MRMKIRTKILICILGMVVFFGVYIIYDRLFKGPVDWVGAIIAVAAFIIIDVVISIIAKNKKK